MVKILGRSKRPSTHSAYARRARNRRTLWAAAILAVVLLVGAYIWPRMNTRPPVVQALSETEEGADLFPLADPVKPLRGGHDINLIPASPPQPREVSEGVSGPMVDIPRASFDFGEIPPDPPVSYVFAIQNTGTADLHLSNLVTSCGCTIAELSSSVIAPGHRADLQVFFDPDFHKTVGQVTRVVWMKSDDPTRPWLEIRVEANVQPEPAP